MSKVRYPTKGTDVRFVMEIVKQLPVFVFVRMFVPDGLRSKVELNRVFMGAFKGGKWENFFFQSRQSPPAPETRTRSTYRRSRF